MAEITIAIAPKCWRFAACVILLLLAALQPSAATDFKVVTDLGTPGGVRFMQEFSDPLIVMDDAKTYIQGAFNLSAPKDISLVTLTVDSFNGVAQTAGTKIELSAEYVASTHPNDPAGMHYEITGVLYHEMTHVWQNSNGAYGTDPFFTGTIEGVADWIRLTAGFPSTGWSPRARGGNWYDGYTTTAYFLDWIQTTQKPNFVNELNLKMANPWSNDFFLQLVDRSVEELWTDYQNSI